MELCQERGSGMWGWVLHQRVEGMESAAQGRGLGSLCWSSGSVWTMLSKGVTSGWSVWSQELNSISVGLFPLEVLHDSMNHTHFL